MQQKDLADATGLRIETLSRLENDRYNANPTARTLRDLARALEVSVDDLTGEGPKEAPSHGSRRTLANADVDDQKSDDQSTQPETAATEEEDRKTLSSDDVDEQGDDD
jgi:transcriptional regulator with XRE-family HTH domain